MAAFSTLSVLGLPGPLFPAFFGEDESNVNLTELWPAAVPGVYHAGLPDPTVVNVEDFTDLFPIALPGGFHEMPPVTADEDDLETGNCFLKLDPDGSTTPADWTAYLDGSPGGTLLSAVETMDFDTSYIRSNGANSEQWYTLENPVDPPLDEEIVRIHVRALVKSDGVFIGSCRLTLGVGGDTVGGGTHFTHANWTMITEVFDLNPNETPPIAFTWPVIDDVEIGITSLTIGGEILCSAMWILVDYCDWVACPRCCCCCLCFAPIVRIPAGAFTVELGVDDLVCPALVFTVPFCGFYFLGGCEFQHGGSLGDCAPDYVPFAVSGQVYSTTNERTYELRIVGVSIVGNVLSSGGDCASLQIIFSLWDVDSNADAGTITFGPSNTVLTQCEPYHLSHVDMNDITLTTIHSVSVDGSASITIDCSDDNTGEIPIP